jgi:DNA-binding IscR family transcriptional regulator
MQSAEIAAKVGVSQPETAKVLQLLVWGGFITSRRGMKGGFQLATSPAHITMRQALDFFLAKKTVEPDGHCPVMCALREKVTPGQEAFAKLTLAEIAARPYKTSHKHCARKAGVK